MKTKIQFITSILVCFSCTVIAYQEVTHEELTDRSYINSSLSKDLTLLSALGIGDREVFESGKLSRINLRPDLQLKLPLFIMRSGASFEDEGFRPLTHFFDPFNEGNDTVNHLLGFISPLWALEEFPQQDYSYSSARSYLIDALVSISDEERDQNFANLFRSLGHIVHHIQDMAQPQHVRQNSHLKLDWLHDGFGIEDHSLYEVYTGYVTEGATDNSQAVDAHLQVRLFDQFNGYAPVIFTNPRDYWHTEGEDNYAGQGLAEFTNREFVSKDTNFGMSDAKKYPLPNKITATPFTIADVNSIFQTYRMAVPPLCEESLYNPNANLNKLATTTVDEAASTEVTKPCTMRFYSMQIKDNLRPEKSGQNAFATTESIYNQDIEGYNSSRENPHCQYNLNVPCGAHRVEKKFTLNKINFWSSYPFLLSRAVGYSSGLLNYFFRGRLETEQVKYAFDLARNKTVVSMLIKNAIDAEQTPEWSEESILAGAKMVVAVKYKDSQGVESRVVSDEVVLLEDIYPDQVSLERYSFHYEMPADAIAIEERLVISGQIGSEENAVAFGTIEPESVLLATEHTNLTADFDNPRVVLFTFQQSVLRSVDGGATWVRVLGPLIRTSSKRSSDNIGNGMIPRVESFGIGKAIFVSGAYKENYCTEDGGLSWLDCAGILNYPNQLYFYHLNESINHTEKGLIRLNYQTRYGVTLSYSEDEGRSWRLGKTFEEANGYAQHNGRFLTNGTYFKSKATTPFSIIKNLGKGVMQMHLGWNLSQDEEESLCYAWNNSLDPEDLWCNFNAVLLLQSNDFGENWVEMGLKSANYFKHLEGGLTHMPDVQRMFRVTDLLLNETYSDSPPQGGLEVSDDLGSSWRTVFIAPTNTFITNSAYLGHGSMVALTKGSFNNLGAFEFIRTDDYGETWRSVSKINSMSFERVGKFPEDMLHTGQIFRFPSYKPQSSIVDIAAVPLTEELLSIVK